MHSKHSKDSEIIESWVNAGTTWWLEDINGMRAGIGELREQIRAGPLVIEFLMELVLRFQIRC